MELKPCPFCGFKPDLEDPDTLYPSGILWRYSPEGFISYHRFSDRKEGDNHVWAMHCVETAGGCGVEINADSKLQAIAKWNSRI